MDFNTICDIVSLFAILFCIFGLYALGAILLMTFGVVFFYILASFFWKGR